MRSRRSSTQRTSASTCATWGSRPTSTRGCRGSCSDERARGGEAPPRGHGAGQRPARPRADPLGRRHPYARRDRGRIGSQAEVEGPRRRPRRTRRRPPRRGLRRHPARQARAAPGAAPARVRSRARRHGRRHGRGRRAQAPRGGQRRGGGGGHQHPAGARRAARGRPGRLPRGRAQGDRRLRAGLRRRRRREGARPLRVEPRASHARLQRRRRSPAQAPRRPPRAAGRRRRLARVRRRRGRGVHLGRAQRGHADRPGVPPPRLRAPACDGHARADGPAARGRARRPGGDPPGRGRCVTRLDPATFRLPVERVRDGYYSDAYFNHTKTLLEHEDRHPAVLMQVFQKKESILGGIDEAIAVLKLGSGRRRPDGIWDDGWPHLTVKALHEGDPIAPREPVLTIEGDYSLFAHLETVYLGSLARRTMVMRNVREVVDAARGKQIFYFPARHDHWLVQTGDGWAAHVAGAIGVSTDAQASWWGGRGLGTVPHGLIAAYGGDTVAAARAFADRFAGEMTITVLVDFVNDSITTALAVAEALGDKLWGVRLDTSETLVDRGLWDEMGDDKPTGVNPRLVRKVRAALNDAGHPNVHIVVSGGFDAERIRAFEAEEVPVDAYGVGSSLIRGGNDFTADIVQVGGKPVAKVGRRLNPSDRLARVE